MPLATYLSLLLHVGDERLLHEVRRIGTKRRAGLLFVLGHAGGKVPAGLPRRGPLIQRNARKSGPEIASVIELNLRMTVPIAISTLVGSLDGHLKRKRERKALAGGRGSDSYLRKSLMTIYVAYALLASHQGPTEHMQLAMRDLAHAHADNVHVIHVGCEEPLRVLVHGGKSPTPGTRHVRREREPRKPLNFPHYC